MRLLIILFLLPFTSVAQQKITVHTNKIEHFFKKVDRIELVEIKQSCDTFYVSFPPDTNVITDTIRTAAFKSLLIKDSIDYSRIQKRVSLSGNEIDSLKSIFLDDKSSIYGGRAMCYSPRNGIFFYNKKGELLAYYEYCFECNNYRLFNIPWDVNLSLHQRTLIMDFFKSHEIRTYYRDC